MPQVSVIGPFRKSDLAEQFRTDPGTPRHLRARQRLPPAARARPRQIDERTTRGLQGDHPGPEFAQHFPVETGADFAGEDEIFSAIIADQQRAESLAASFRCSEPANHKLLFAQTFYFDPCSASAPRLVGGGTPFR